MLFLSNVSTRVLGGCRFQQYVEFYSAKISFYKRPLLSRFYINIQKIRINCSPKVSKIPLSLSIARYSEKFLADCFTFQSEWHVYFLVIQLSLLLVIFTSCMFSNTDHRLKYFCYLVIRSNNIFQAHFYHLLLS